MEAAEHEALGRLPEASPCGHSPTAPSAPSTASLCAQRCGERVPLCDETGWRAGQGTSLLSLLSLHGECRPPGCEAVEGCASPRRAANRARRFTGNLRASWSYGS